MIVMIIWWIKAIIVFACAVFITVFVVVNCVEVLAFIWGWFLRIGMVNKTPLYTNEEFDQMTW